MILTNGGFQDIFVAKYDSGGNVLWARRAGGSNNDSGSGIAVNEGGNCYVTGYFVSMFATFGGITLTNSGAPYGCYSSFVVKYDNAGNVACGLRRTGAQNTTFAPQVPQPQKLKCTTWEPRRALAGAAPSIHRADRHTQSYLANLVSLAI